MVRKICGVRDYINKALSKAEYDKLEDGSFSGRIPECPGVIAFSKTLFECQKELESVLEGWLIIKMRHSDTLPVLDNLDINANIPHGDEAVANA
ncbi:MAG: type II toxin-antitoxin system HicB family antitoxin [Candidatus Methanoperedens sp.]|nr:type II toxin-antitoxin system HicB family antitoxin [Candidatus Methanoperedens sp.]